MNCVNAKKFSMCMQTLSETEYLCESAFGHHFEINEIASVHGLFSEQMEIAVFSEYYLCLPGKTVFQIIWSELCAKLSVANHTYTYIYAVLVAVVVVVIVVVVVDIQLNGHFPC